MAVERRLQEEAWNVLDMAVGKHVERDEDEFGKKYGYKRR